MIKFIGSFGSQDVVFVEVFGDGVSSSISFDLVDAPFRVSFPDKFFPIDTTPPSVSSSQAGQTAVVSVNKSMVTISFGIVPSSGPGQETQVTFGLVYSG